MALQERSETLRQCDMCGMHMPEGQMIKHRMTSSLFKNMEMRIRRKYVEVASQCANMEFNPKGKKGEETIEGVELFT